MLTFIAITFFVLAMIGFCIEEWEKIEARKAVIEMNKRQKRENGGR